MQARFIRRAAGVLACAAPVAATAQPAASRDTASVSQLGTITVTGSRVPMDGNPPVQVSVLTTEQIEKSSATTVQALLSAQSGIHVIDSIGAADQAAIDLRGFGLTAPSNTLILIDGVPQNNNDLSAPLLGIVPLDRIERIEIVRGSGSVQYGGGTTGGVTHLITKQSHSDAEPVSASATATVGSYGRRQLDAAIGLHNAQMALDVYGQTLRTDNYRDNNQERRDSGGLSLGFCHAGGSVRLYARTSHQKLGLPGPRRVDPATGLDEYEDDPRGTSTPDDVIKTRSDAFGVQAAQPLGRGTLYAELGQRDKSLNGFTGSAFGDTTRAQTLSETTGSVRYRLPIADDHALIAGVDSRDSDLNATNTYSFSPVSDRWKARQRQRGVFAEAQIRATNTTRITLGGRRQYAGDELHTLSGFSGNADETRRLNAWQAAIGQELDSGVTVYGKIGRSFRLANSDELLYVATPLKPQISSDKELGVTWAAEGSSARLTWFRYDLIHEIQYNPMTFSNMNLDPTRRQGIEIEGRHALTRTLTLDANATWLQAEFRSGNEGGVDLTGNTVPLVPKWMANLGATWQPDAKLFVSLAAQYVSAARMDNDQANAFDTRLDEYVLVNGKVGYRYTKHVSVTLALNNLFDRDYATYGIGSSGIGPDGAYNLYPAIGRNVQASLTIRY